MNIFKSTSQQQRNLGSRIHPLARGKKLVLATSLMALSCLAFSPAWAGDYSRANSSLASIHLASVSMHIGPGGFHLGLGAPYYGHGYVRPHLHVRPVPQLYWKPSRHHGHRYHYTSPKRFYRGHGWKNDRPRSNFRGKGGRGYGGYHGGRR